MTKAPPSSPPGPNSARRARQAEALRRNLARRKQQARDRAAGADSAESPAKGGVGKPDGTAG